VVVSGVVSSNCDCTIVPGFGAIRIATPFTIAALPENVSKIVIGCR
jgi:hypothetical protein